MSSFNLCVLKTFCVPHTGIYCCNNKGKCSPTFRTKEGLVFMDSILFKIKCAFSLTTFPHTMLSPKQMSSYFFILSEIPTPPTLCQECLKTRNSARLKGSYTSWSYQSSSGKKLQCKYLLKIMNVARSLVAMIKQRSCKIYK